MSGPCFAKVHLLSLSWFLAYKKIEGFFGEVLVEAKKHLREKSLLGEEGLEEEREEDWKRRRASIHI